MRSLASILLLSFLAVPLLAQDTTKSAPKKKRDANVITVEEIDLIRNEASNAREIVTRLRPQFLRGRGANSFGNSSSGRAIPLPRVVLDGAPYGEAPSLAQIPAMMVREIRFLSSGDASIKYGTGYDGGAILVTTR